MFPKCFHTPVPEVPPEIIGQCFLHPFLIAAYHNDILWKINTYPPSHRFFRPEEEEDDDVKLSLNGLVYSGVISFISFQLVIYGLNFLHPGAWLAFLWRIIKKNLDVQAFFFFFFLTIGLEAVKVFLEGRGERMKGANTTAVTTKTQK
jgi:hypothetical protein